MNNDDYTIICSRCGSEMKISSRCCMKCGSLNPEHPDNKGYEKYFNKIDCLSINKKINSPS